VKDLRAVAKNADERVAYAETRAGKEVENLRSKFSREQTKVHNVVEKMEQLKMELKMLESNDTSVTSIWKKKCVELFEVCGALKEENTEVRDLCNELIVQGVHLSDALQATRDSVDNASHISNQDPFSATKRTIG
jgi:hypothetical protein